MNNQPHRTLPNNYILLLVHNVLTDTTFTGRLVAVLIGCLIPIIVSIMFTVANVIYTGVESMLYTNDYRQADILICVATFACAYVMSTAFDKIIKACIVAPITEDVPENPSHQSND